MNPPDTRLPTGICPLDAWGVIRAQGADAAAFLHSQLTQDILGLGPDEARLAGYCSAKGRLLASFIVWRNPAHDEVLLACSADVLPATLKRLSMFVLRAKCKLSDASDQVALFGLAGDDATAALGGAAPVRDWQRRDAAIRLPASLGLARYLWIGERPSALAALPALAPAAWQWLDVHSGVPSVVGGTVEQFVPQMINLELVGGVNFQKGCYPGQEVVARSQYRGTVKRRAMLFRSAAAAVPGQEVFSSADPAQPAGMVVNAASLDGQHAALVETKLAAIGQTLHLGAADGPPLTPVPLPYPLPSDAA